MMHLTTQFLGSDLLVVLPIIVVFTFTLQCIVEEIQGPTQARARKGRFISG